MYFTPNYSCIHSYIQFQHNGEILVQLLNLSTRMVCSVNWDASMVHMLICNFISCIQTWTSLNYYYNALDQQ